MPFGSTCVFLTETMDGTKVKVMSRSRCVRGNLSSFDVKRVDELGFPTRRLNQTNAAQFLCGSESSETAN
jgi:hypothetical protein